jgi:hypothetical protein
MFFYTSLFVASFIVAFIALWLYKSLVDIGKSFYQAILPSSKNDITAHVEESNSPVTVNEAKTPWGWGGHATPATEARIQAAVPDKSASNVPWGWPGSKHKVRTYQVKGGIPIRAGKDAQAVAWSVADKTSPGAARKRAQKIGWPYREDQFEFAGDTYKVTQKAKPRKTNLKKTAKPWGW